ncbi:transketolase [Tropicibacter naphthalenivorans]|uniref:Transketolase n=1 Tax=Tropicibacter naphthalenivorans TaxID=441103 RepID=A0A0P1GQM3_9RHOB|nr:transketolase [Tropicibacter naphthalenivorans]CUH77538.1 Transketolase 1 [Tropicibacter naphthalenivorans]SMC56454.1 transketolase [Tropicibacter naphthalenivorans]
MTEAPKLSAAKLREMANAIRFLAMDAIVRAQDGHPGTPLGGADIVTGLVTQHLKYDPKNPTWPDRDRFVHSAGHGSMLLYAMLHLQGYEKLDIEQIKSFRVLGSHTAGHPEYDPEAGIETTTGPLGQGITNAVGMAIAEQILNAEYGDDIVDHHTYAYTGDGCLMEGIAAEAIAIAGHLRLGKLIYLWDDNRMTDDGPTDQAVTEDQVVRFENNGWHVQSVDGHDAQAVADAIAQAKADPRPSMIACRTLIGFGIPRIQNDRAAHGGKIFVEDTDAARENLGWTHAPFEIPQDLYEAWHQAGARGAAEREAWEARLAALPEAKRAAFQRRLNGDLPDGWQDALQGIKQTLATDGQARAGIKASGEVLSTLAGAVPELISGAPDLEAATQHKRQLAPFTRDDRTGRYIHYGVREFAMGAIMNGMTVHGGVVSVGTTFLVFSDYMRHTLRMAALMGIPGIFVFSHDSIGIGKNGPTHQPVEYLASLRAYPNMYTIRPADGAEMAEAWEIAMQRRQGPTNIICSRQPLPAVREGVTGENLTARGAYVLAEATGARQATLLATGSEVAIALKAREALQAQGIGAAVVSMPCWAAFEEQDKAYRDAVLGRGTVRVGIEAAVQFGWDRYIGEDGAFIGMTGFGASGAETDLYKHFGITAEAVVDAVKARL